ncbi:MAG: HAD-IA family hydrolase [Elusimicrobiota bacterium]
MIKVIVFDFDGVILESADIKTDAFAELFSDYPGKQKEIVDYHLANAGISRYVKFRHIYKNILKLPLTELEEKELGSRFTRIVFEKILETPFVRGAREFLEDNRKEYKMFIASGTPEEELLEIILKRGLNKYFTEIHGSPKKKLDIITGIIARHGLRKNEILYIGDAQSDRIAAEQAGVNFVERNSSVGKYDADKSIIADLEHLDACVKKLNKDI